MPSKLLSIWFLAILATQASCQNEPKPSPSPSPKIPLANMNYEISFEKKIMTSQETSLGTMEIARLGDYLLLHDLHVSARRLTCMKYSSGQEIWNIPSNVHHFFIYEGQIIADFYGRIAAYELETGKELWEIKGAIISYRYPDGALLGDKVMAFKGEDKMILNLKSRSIERPQKGAILAYHFGVDGQLVERSLIGTENHYKYRGELKAVVIVEDAKGERQDYVWSLDSKKRLFYLSHFDAEGELLDSQNWPMDEGSRQPMDYFSGSPEPEKLDIEVYFLDGQLYFLENYIHYRWSWGRGSNRITAVDWQSGRLSYQLWGQSPKAKKTADFHRFHFFDHTILYSNHIMHFQDGDGLFSRFDPQKGKILDSLPQQVTLFRNYDADHLLAFSYERKQIDQSSEYNNAVEMKMWNRQRNEFSKTFRFDFQAAYPYPPSVFAEDGLVIFYYYITDKQRSELQCYRVRKKD